MSDSAHCLHTSGAADPVWIHTDPYSNRPRFPKLKEDLSADVCIIGSGIAGISIAYELVAHGVRVVMIEARDAISGESSRTTGHLASALDDHYTEIASKHGDTAAKLIAESHDWAIRRVGDIATKLNIE